MKDLPEINQPIRELKGVGPALEKALGSLGINSIQDLLEHLPNRFEDRTLVVPIKQLPINQDCVINAQILSVSTRKSKKGALIIQARVRDESGEINVLWFNQRYLLKLLQPGRLFNFYGLKRISPSMGNPFMAKKIISRPEIAPIYPLSSGLSQYQLARLIEQARGLLQKMPDIIPSIYLEQLTLPNRADALESCHFPTTLESLQKARELLGSEELLLLSLAILKTKSERQSLKAKSVKVDGEFLSAFTKSLPFNLTDGQRKAAWEILQDLSGKYPMNRLLYGEVGSGKTAVALILAAQALRSGWRVAILAPTTALALQLNENAKNALQPHGFSVSVITGHKKEDANADLLIGTHALIQKGLDLSSMDLVIIDEQHRFGVEQRQFVLNQNPSAHLLMMTATPIPRSLAQTIFGHLDLSFLAGKPVHQKPVETVRFTSSLRNQVELDIAKRLERQEPGYIICPLIEQSSPQEETLFGSEKKTIQQEKTRLTTAFPNAKIAVLHGRLSSAEKERVMQSFKDGEVDILLSTTVVEVGIDNPKATWILIENADCFGLSTLHQLRGRVGRGEKASICYLADGEQSLNATQRLEALTKSNNGLELAEVDLSLRGPGEIVGLEQSGLPPLRYADWSDHERAKKMFAIAEKIMKDGIEKYPELYSATMRFYQSNEKGAA